MPDHTHDPRTPAGRAALRACPFCGSEAQLTSTVDGMENEIPAVICYGCRAEMPGFRPLTAEQVVERWNHRDERDALAALLREAREAVARGPAAIVMLLADIDAALAKGPRP